jgi:DNA polymerase I-like protein with 3'-5' exonuclease and polymerase domains
MCVERPAGYFTIDEERIVGQMLRFILTNPNYEIVGQFFGYDLQYIRQFLFCEPRCHLDTFVGHHLCWPGVPGGLYFIAGLYNRYYRYWKDEGKEWDIHLPQEQWWNYNCVDGVNTWEASYHIERLIKQCPRKRVRDGIISTYFVDLTERMKEQMEVFHLQVEMMNDGIAIDKRARMAMFYDVWLEMCDMEVKFERIMPERVAAEIMTKTGKSPWYSSPKQLCNFFYHICSIPAVHNDSGGERMDDDALQRIKILEPLFRDLCTDLQNYRSLGVFRNNFLTATLDPDGRMRCQFTQLPATFRWSSKENAFGRGTNLQNVPRGD